MTRNYRPHRGWWIAGVLLLLGSTLGANWALNGSLFASISPGENSTKQVRTEPPQLVSALGMVDVEGGVVSLYPVQQGRVLEIAAEGTIVKKADVLLRLDNRLAQYQLDEAKAALASTVAQRNKAENAEKQHKNLIAQQKIAEQTALHKKNVVSQQLKKFDKLNEGTDFDRNILVEQENLAQDSVSAEALKTKALELLSDDLLSEIQRADADVLAKEAQMKKAQFALDECNLTAPANGHVLRVSVAVGEVIGPNPSQPVMTFCPDTPRIVRAEVLQEWASLVRIGQSVSIKDDIQEGEISTGTVKSISGWIAPKRQKIIEPFMFNDVRTLECLIQVSPSASVRIGQRVRVRIDVHSK